MASKVGHHEIPLMSFVRDFTFDATHPLRQLLPARWRRRITAALLVAVLTIAPIQAAYIDWSVERAMAAGQRVTDLIVSQLVQNIQASPRTRGLGARPPAKSTPHTKARKGHAERIRRATTGRERP